MNVKSGAKILFELSENSDGSLDIAKVKAVCEYVESNIPQFFRLGLLKEFLKLVKRRIESGKARVLYAGELSKSGKDSLVDFIKKKNPVAEAEFVRDDSLIGGVRVEVGDFVWDNSVKMKLDELANSFK